MSEAASRVLAWFPLATAVLAGAFSMFFFIYSETGVYFLNFGVGGLATAAVIGPGVIISSVVNQVLLTRRPKPKRISIAEGILFCVQVILVAVLIWQAFDQWSLASIPLTLLVVGVAIATTVLLNRRSTAELAAVSPAA